MAPGLDLSGIDPRYADEVRRQLDVCVDTLSQRRDEHVDFLLGDPGGGW